MLNIYITYATRRTSDIGTIGEYIILRIFFIVLTIFFSLGVHYTISSNALNELKCFMDLAIIDRFTTVYSLGIYPLKAVLNVAFKVYIQIKKKYVNILLTYQSHNMRVYHIYP